MLEARFGRWQAPASARGTKAFSAAIPDPRPRIILIDRPQSPQSLILAGEVTNVIGTDDLVAMGEANDVLGGTFLSRLNMELRENKHWAYGAFGILNRVEHQVPYLVFAPVQADRTGDLIAAARAQLQQFLGPNGVTAAELERTINGSIRELPGSFETSQAVLGGLQQNDLYRRPDDYYSTVASRLQAPDRRRSRRRRAPRARSVEVRLGRGRRRLAGAQPARAARPADRGRARRALRRGRIASGGEQAGDVAHLAAGAGFALAVEVEMGGGVGEDVRPSRRLPPPTRLRISTRGAVRSVAPSGRPQIARM